MKKTICFLLICITGIFFSCKEDEGTFTPHSHETHKPKYERSIVNFQDMKAKLSENSGQSALFSNIANKGGDDYIQAIDSTYIIQFTNDTLTTYTLRVSTLDDDNYSYSNLIIRILNGETEEFIAHYSPTPEWQAAHNNGEHLPYDGELELTDVNGISVLEDNEDVTEGKVGACHFEIESNHTDCYGSTCPCTDGNGTTQYSITVVCTSSSSGGSGEGGSGGGSGGGGGSGDGGSGSGGGDLPTDPMGNMGLISSYFFLTTAEQYYLYSHHSERLALNKYLLENHDFDDQDFVYEWLSQLVSGGLEYTLNMEFLAFQDDYRDKMSQNELAIFDTLSPQSQFKYLKNAYFATKKAKDLYPSSQHNGKGDAFRHAYFNALNVVSIGSAYAELLSTAHEEGPSLYQYHYKEVSMDLHNNQIGRNYGNVLVIGTHLSAQYLIQQALNNGELMYLNPLGFTIGNNYYQFYANYNSTLTPTNQ